jgi:hypothetical protein
MVMMVLLMVLMVLLLIRQVLVIPLMVLMVLIIRAGAGHSPDGSNPAKQNRTSDQMIRMVLVSLIKLTKLINNKLWC